MSTLENLQHTAQATYDELRTIWYRDHPGSTPALLVVEIASGDAGYSRSADTIWVRIGEGNLTDVDDLEPRRWPVWRIQLIHEMLHEFQYKAVGADISPAGRALCITHQQSFYGPGHDDAFFTAIDRVGPLLGLTPESLIRAI